MTGRPGSLLDGRDVAQTQISFRKEQSEFSIGECRHRNNGRHQKWFLGPFDPRR